MRIIAGDNKGRKLEGPENRNLRPTADKVKEALFSILAPNICGTVVCDLFAGSAGLGLEALSRGASFCYFGDNSKESIGIITRNIQRCGEEERTRVIPGDYRKTLDMIKDKVDIFILDPPYGRGLLGESMEIIREKDLLASGGIIVAEHHKREELPEEFCGFKKTKEKKYGTVVLSFFM